MTRKKMIIIIGISALLLIGAGVAFFLMGPKSELPPSATTEDDGKTADPEDGGNAGSIYNLKTFIVNLADPGGEKYLRVSIKIEIKNEMYIAKIDDRLPMLKDNILTFLSSKAFSDIKTLEGKKMLKTEIISNLNTLLQGDIVTNLFFTEFVVQ